MNKEQLETNIAALELLVNETADKSTDFQAQLERAKQELKDINKPELTPMQFDDIWEAVNEAIANFDFEDNDNYEFEYELDYDGRVSCSNIGFHSTDQLVDKVVDKVAKLFKEATYPEDGEKLDTTEPDHHAPTENQPVTQEIPELKEHKDEVTAKPSEKDMENFNERIQKQKQESKEKTFKKRTWFSK